MKEKVWENRVQKGSADFIGIGVEKCGTTWVYKMLKAHPEIGFSKVKEVNFFNNVWGLTGRHKSKLEKWGIKSYGKYFNEGKVVGEFSPNYMADPKVASRIYRYFPNVKIIVVLRNPIEKILSHYNSRKYAHTHERCKTFEEAITKHLEYIERSLYYPQLKRYFDLFPRENIKVLFFEDISSNSGKVVRDLYRFLDVNSSFVPKGIYQKSNVARKVRYGFFDRVIKFLFVVFRKIFPKMPPPAVVSLGDDILQALRNFNSQPLKKESMKEETRKSLLKIFRPDIKKTGKLLGRDLSLWFE